MAMHHRSNSGYSGEGINLGLIAADFTWVVKSMFKSSSWSVVMSGDGKPSNTVNVNYSASTDILTNNTRDPATVLNAYGEPTTANATAIQGSTLNPKSWFVVKSQVGNASLCIQMGDIADGYVSLRIKFSAGGFSTTGISSTTCPGPTTANDEKVLWGSGTNSAPGTTDWFISNRSPRTARFHSGVDDSGTIPLAWFALQDNASDVVHCAILWDYLTGLNSGDTIPHAVVASGGGGGDNRYGVVYTGHWADETLVGTPGRNWAARFGTLTQEMQMAYLTNSTGPLHLTMGVNTASQLSDDVPPVLARRSTIATPNGIKGQSQLLKLQGSARTFGFPTSIGGGTNNWVAVGSFLVPYNYADVGIGAGSKLITR